MQKVTSIIIYVKKLSVSVTPDLQMWIDIDTIALYTLIHEMIKKALQYCRAMNVDKISKRQPNIHNFHNIVFVSLPAKLFQIIQGNVRKSVTWQDRHFGYLAVYIMFRWFAFVDFRF